MDNNPPEREQPKPQRNVNLGEEFRPFDQRYARQDVSRIPIAKQSKSSIVLNIENLKVPLNINVLTSRTTKGDAITPLLLLSQN